MRDSFLPLSNHGPCFPATLRSRDELVKERVVTSLTLIHDVTQLQPQSAGGAIGTELPLFHVWSKGARARCHSVCPLLLGGHFYLHENKVDGIPHDSHHNVVLEGHTSTGRGFSLQKGREATHV